MVLPDRTVSREGTEQPAVEAKGLPNDDWTNPAQDDVEENVSVDEEEEEEETEEQAAAREAAALQNSLEVIEKDKRAEEVQSEIAELSYIANKHSGQLRNHLANIAQIERRVDKQNDRLEKLQAEVQKTHQERERLIKGLERFEKQAEFSQSEVNKGERNLEVYNAYVDLRKDDRPSAREMEI